MKTYSLLILGRHTYKKDFDITNSRECWEFQSISLLEEFKKLSNVNINIVHVHHPKRDNDLDYSKLPEADCILFNGLPVAFEQLDLVKLKEATGYKKLVTFLERGLTNSGIDWTFEFKGDLTPNTTFIPGPINSKLYKTGEKEPRSILIDHCYGETSVCLCHSIQKWLEPLKDEYKIYKLIRPDEKNPIVEPFVTPIKETNFIDYVQILGKMENYVVSHCESFGFTNIDCLQLGVRIFTPPNFLCKRGIQDYFEIPIFNNRDEFINLLKQPISKSLLDRRIAKLTTYPQVVKIIDKKFKELLLTDDRLLLQKQLSVIDNELEEIRK